jgi:hypothetical protein
MWSLGDRSLDGWLNVRRDCDRWRYFFRLVDHFFFNRRSDMDGLGSFQYAKLFTKLVGKPVFHSVGMGRYRHTHVL